MSIRRSLDVLLLAPLLLALLFLLLLAACEPSEGVGALRLRPNVRTVVEFPVVDRACVTDSACPGYVNPFIRDVARDGATIAVLFTWPVFNGREFAHNAGVVYSADHGESWTRVALESTTPELVSDLDPVGIVVRGSDAYLLAPYESDVGIGRPTWIHVSRVELATGLTTGVGILNTELVHDDGTTLHSYDYFGPNPAFASDWTTWDVATASRITMEAETLTAEPGRHYCGGSGVHWIMTRSLRGGVAIHGACHNAEGLACMGSAYPSTDWRARFDCVPEAEWPVPEAARHTETTFVAAGIPPTVLFTERVGDADVTRAARVDFRGGPVAHVGDVGPGQILFPIRNGATWAGSDRPRFGDLVALVEPLPDESVQTTLHRANRSGTFPPTTLPTRPCDPGEYCGYLPTDTTSLVFQFGASPLQYALPVGPEEYLLFYVLNVRRPSSGQLQNVMFVARERLEVPSTPAGPIERACARELACFPWSATDLSSCTHRWSRSLWTDAQRAAFVTATDCDAIAAADPVARDGEPADCVPDTFECLGNVGFTCGIGLVTPSGATGPVRRVLVDCNENDGACTIEAGRPPTCSPAALGCPDARGCAPSGQAIMCGPNGVLDCPARGLECLDTVIDGFTVFGCYERGTLCPGDHSITSRCDGETIVRCSGAGLQSAERDCAAIPGMHCAEAPYTDCFADGIECVEGTARCEGEHLHYCFYGSPRDIDCGALGLRCEVTTDGLIAARCATGAAPPPPVDAGVPPDAGPPGCSEAALGPAVPEEETPDYPVATGGVIPDGTYELTRYQIWSGTAQPYTHQETLVFAGSSLSVRSNHSAIGGGCSSTGTYTTMDTSLTYETTCTQCPSAPTMTWRYLLTATSLVILDGSQIRTYTRR